MMQNASMDLETMKYIAEASAKAAADELARALRDEIRIELRRTEEVLASKITNEFQSRFGDMTSTEHLVQHSRLSQFLEWADTTRTSMWKAIVGHTVKWVLVIIVASYFILHRQG